jgi:vacuolar-type H+-ATPase subunit D/Vma8
MTATATSDSHCELLDLVDELLGFRNRLNNLLKSAFFNLSTTKYQIGAENVTELQYDRRMKSAWKLEYSKDGKGVVAMRKNMTADPIEWFGLLAPQSLRKAQGDFKTVVGILVEIDNINTLIKRAESDIIKQQTAI